MKPDKKDSNWPVFKAIFDVIFKIKEKDNDGILPRPKHQTADQKKSGGVKR
jgi:hypothetical protein